MTSGFPEKSGKIYVFPFFEYYAELRSALHKIRSCKLAYLFIAFMKPLPDIVKAGEMCSSLREDLSMILPYPREAFGCGIPSGDA
jgi:hypothetical protein